jgi:hypothetical protein
MDFIVKSGDIEDHFHGDSMYRFDNNGLLIVTSDQGKQRTYSPNGWDYIEQDTPSGPNAWAL